MRFQPFKIICQRKRAFSSLCKFNEIPDSTPWRMENLTCQLSRRVSMLLEKTSLFKCTLTKKSAELDAACGGWLALANERKCGGGSEHGKNELKFVILSKH